MAEAPHADELGLAEQAHHDAWRAEVRHAASVPPSAQAGCLQRHAPG